ncbi:MAG: Fic family protein [Bacteroidales bacterium]|nr:Fic family protein [Bacteroidales bacterium]
MLFIAVYHQRLSSKHVFCKGNGRTHRFARTGIGICVIDNGGNHGNDNVGANLCVRPAVCPPCCVFALLCVRPYFAFQGMRQFELHPCGM